MQSVGGYDGTPRMYALLLEYDTLERPLEVVRFDVRHDTVGVPEIPYELFKSKILPTLTAKGVDLQQAVELVYAACVEKKVIINGRFENFSKSPAEMKEESKMGIPGDDPAIRAATAVTEDKIYGNLKSYWGKVVEIAKEVLQLNPSVDFKHTPHANPHMERGEATRPDAMSFLIQSKMPDRFKESSALFFCNVAILKEDKISDKPKEREDVGVIRHGYILRC